MKTQHGYLLFFVVLLVCGVVRGGNFDHDDDGNVDLDDLQDFALCLGGPQVEASPGCVVIHDGDADLDVDLKDFSLFQAEFGEAPPPIIPAQLAGNSLGAYPFFEYVRAFNEDAPVELGIDPSRFPGIVGQVGDVYVVEAKAAGAWEVDPTLVDVTPDGPQTVTFGGTTLPENTFTLAGPYDLESATFVPEIGDYTGLGRGYDIVVDVNQNGELDGGDYIDGLGSEAGLYIVHDTTQAGPLPVTQITYSGGPWLGQRAYYPSDIAALGALPLVVISHGNGHDYTWYDYLGTHLASYGYLVMAHQNNTGPGIETASKTTLTNTDYLLGNQDVIEGGILDGHIDSHRIVWIGHSRGGEGVCRAYTRLFDGEYTPVNYALEDIILVSSISPNDYLGRFSSNPHDVNFHLLQGAADGDNAGWPDQESDAPFHVYERAEGYRQATYVHGADHNDFNCCGWDDFEGPAGTAIGREEAQRVAKAVYLALVKHYVERNVPARDYLWRQYESLRPIGVNENTIVGREYIEGPGEGVFVIDDFQSESALGTSSSGGAVVYDVQFLEEGQLDDTDGTFTWNEGDPMNGMVRGRTDDLTRGLVLEWSAGDDRYLEFEIVPAAQDFSEYAYLAFRACQGTRHPYTTAVLEDSTFTVTLRDASEVTSSINFGAYGAGLEEPYQRTGSGSGAGWQNEFETVRIRLTDFLHHGSGLNLGEIVAVRFDFGSSFGSSQGRIGLDNILLSKDLPPFFVPLSLSLAMPPPEFLPADAPTHIEVEILEGSDTLVESSALLHYRYGDGAYQSVPLVQLAGELWQGTLPPPDCGDQPVYYFSAEGVSTGVVYQPSGGAANPFVSYVGTFVSILDDDFQTGQGWTFADDATLTSGGWERTMPTSDGSYGEPTQDYDGSGRCLLTENGYHRDVDKGPTWATSPALNLSGTTDPVLRYARWMACDDAGTDAQDFLYVELSDDDGATWEIVEVVADNQMWTPVELYIADFVDLTSQVRLRFWTDDTPNNSRTEAGVDAVKVFDVECP